MDDPQGFLNVETPKPAEVVDILATPEAAPAPEVQAPAPIEMAPAVEVPAPEVVGTLPATSTPPIEAAPRPIEATPVDKNFETVFNALQRVSNGHDEALEAVPEPNRQAFVDHQAQIAAKIIELYRANKAEPVVVLDLVREGLAAIPGVDKDYLEQEAKIRTDQVLRSLEGLSSELTV